MKIVTYENKLLRNKSEEVKDVTQEKIQKLISDMKIFVKKKRGAGLSAIQVGEPVRIFVVNMGKHKEVFVNPEIKKLSDSETTLEEGCLSFPGFFGMVKRPKQVTVQALDENGKPFELEASGILSKVIQHEIDHLDGVLFVDRMKESSNND